MYVVDTDNLIIIQQRHEPFYSRLENRLEAIDKSDVFVTVISTHEQMLGANKFISQAKKRVDIVRGYRMIESAMAGYEQYKMLPFDEPAAIQFENLRKQKVRIGTMDLRIASIALSHDFTVLTRNTVDFERVSGLRFEDWTVAKLDIGVFACKRDRIIVQ